MKRNKNSFPIRRVFLLDELAILLALAVALLIRHSRTIFRLVDVFGNLYIVLPVTLCLFHIMVFLLYDNRKPSIFEQDPIENLMTVIKSKCILLASTLAYLYIVQRSKQVSRTVVILFLLLGIFFDYLFRMLYRSRIKKNSAFDEKVCTLKLDTPYPSDEELSRLLSEKKYDDALIISPDADAAETGRVLAFLEKRGIRSYCGLDCLGYSVRSGIVSDIGDRTAIPAAVRSEKFKLFGIDYSVARTEEAVLHVMRHIKELSGEYICFSNVHTSVMARENPDYAAVLNGSAFTFPDGSSVAQLQRKKGILGAERVAGPDFMEHMFRDTADGHISHYFYGASQETLDALKTNLEKKYPGIDIRGLYSPPFRPLTEEEDKADVEMINASGADIVWIGLGAPKQEKWMQAHKGRIKGVMMGVGAGFDFHAGTIKRAPLWIQKIGLEWLYRLFQDPGRLIKRYFVTNIKFFWYLGLDMLKKS